MIGRLIGWRSSSDGGGVGSLPVGLITVGSKWVYSCVESTIIRVQQFYGLSWTEEINVTQSKMSRPFTVHGRACRGRSLWRQFKKEQGTGEGSKVKGATREFKFKATNTYTCTHMHNNHLLHTSF